MIDFFVLHMDRNSDETLKVTSVVYKCHLRTLKKKLQMTFGVGRHITLILKTIKEK